MGLIRSIKRQNSGISKHLFFTKGEPISWDEPLIKVEQQDYVSEEEDAKFFHFSKDEEYDQDYKEDSFFHTEYKEDIEPKIKKSRPRKKKVDASDDENEDEDFKLTKPKKPRTGPPPIAYSKPGICNKCGKECSNSGALVIHLKSCNPEQIKVEFVMTLIKNLLKVILCLLS